MDRTSLRHEKGDSRGWLSARKSDAFGFQAAESCIPREKGRATHTGNESSRVERAETARVT